MAHTAADVKNLRERTGAGMMDCKKALDETGGDIEAAVDSLRTKGLAAVAKKSSRTAAEGLVGVAVSGTRGVAVEVNSETDFVAKNEQFQDFVRKTTQVALGAASDDVEALKGAAYPDGGTVSDKLTNNVATIGENQQVRRMKTVSVSQGVVVPYMHNAAAPLLGKIGVLVALESEAGADVLEPLGKQIAMHIAAAFPLALNVDGIDPAVVAREAAMQSRRLWLPVVLDVVTFGETATLTNCAIADVEGDGLSADVDAVLIGPEGGFTKGELDAVATRVSLSANVLRVETAALTAAILLTQRNRST